VGTGGGTVLGRASATGGAGSSGESANSAAIRSSLSEALLAALGLGAARASSCSSKLARSTNALGCAPRSSLLTTSSRRSCGASNASAPRSPNRSVPNRSVSSEADSAACVLATALWLVLLVLQLVGQQLAQRGGRALVHGGRRARGRACGRGIPLAGRLLGACGSLGRLTLGSLCRSSLALRLIRRGLLGALGGIRLTVGRSLRLARGACFPRGVLLGAQRGDACVGFGPYGARALVTLSGLGGQLCPARGSLLARRVQHGIEPRHVGGQRVELAVHHGEVRAAAGQQARAHALEGLGGLLERVQLLV
jgi:hypothetical protein